MLAAFLAIMMLLSSSSVLAFEEIYSEGYRSGVLNGLNLNISDRGKTGVGHVMLGKNSTESGDLHMNFGLHKNPWVFKISDKNVYSRMQKYRDKPVVVAFRQKALIKPFESPADFSAHDVMSVDPKLKPNRLCKNTTSDKKIKGKRGVAEGRIVEASYQGNLKSTKTWELIIQLGDRSNAFVQMSTTSKEVYDCATEWLKSGEKVRIGYSEALSNGKGRLTRYNVVELKPVPEGGVVDNFPRAAVNAGFKTKDLPPEIYKAPPASKAISRKAKQ